MLEKLRGSGLTERHAKLLGLTALSPEETKALGARFQRQAAIRILYFDRGASPRGSTGCGMSGRPPGSPARRPSPAVHTGGGRPE